MEKEAKLTWSLVSLGIIGGMTSIITSTVEGVKTEGGVSGFISGLGKGLVGTVTKPVAGALDFASETAQTVRDMASLSNHRCVRECSPGGPAPPEGRLGQLWRGVLSGSACSASGSPAAAKDPRASFLATRQLKPTARSSSSTSPTTSTPSCESRGAL